MLTSHREHRLSKTLTCSSYLLVCLALLWPYLTTGYFFDDMLLSRFAIDTKINGVGFWKITLEFLKGWTTEGRLFPLSTLWAHALWWSNPGLTTYRVLHVGLVALNIFFFIGLITRLGGTRRFAFLTTLILLGLFQIRNYHDPITSYSGLMQLVTLFGLASAWFLTRKNFWASGLLFICALLTYEVGLVFFPVLFIIACHVSDRRWKAKSPWLYAVITAIYLVIVFWLRQVHHTYAGVQPNFDWHALRAYACQFSGALPLSYAIFGRSGFFGLHTFTQYPLISLPSLGVFLASGTLLFYWLKSQPAFESKVLRQIALVLIFLTPLLMAASKRYQTEISRPGQAYLPVYLSYFGVALFTALWLSRFRFRFWSALTAAFGIALVIALSFGTNRIAARQMNQQWTYPRGIVEQSIENGFLNSLPENSTVLVQRDYHYYISDKYLQFHTGKKVNVEHLDQHFNPQENQNGYLLRYEAQNRHEGFVSLSKIQSIEWDQNKNPRRIMTDGDTRVMIHSKNSFKEIGITDGNKTYQSNDGHLTLQADPLLLRLSGGSPSPKWF